MPLSHSSKAYKFCVVVGAAITWFAIVGQLYLNIENRAMSLPQTIIKFASYFTILTNILVAICFTYVAFQPNGKWGKFFSRPQVASAITVYIFVVGLVYNTVLRWQWSPQGLQLIVDNLLHVITPVWFLAYWVLFVPKASLLYKKRLGLVNLSTCVLLLYFIKRCHYQYVSLLFCRCSAVQLWPSVSKYRSTSTCFFRLIIIVSSSSNVA